MKVREDEVEFADGTKGTYGVVDKPDGALIIPKLSHDQYVLIRIHRYTTGKSAWEFPCGCVEDVQMKPEEIARRELQEETGYLAERMTILASLYSSDGYASQMMHAFLAEHLTSGQPKPDSGELGIEIKTFSSEEIERMIMDGNITDAQSVAAWGVLRIRERNHA